MSRILVWDAPVRLFHWTFAVLVVFSFTTGTLGGNWMEWHLKSGYAILALLVFRIMWGIVGSDTARFSSFIRSPLAAVEYLRARLAGRHTTILGHNPLGGWAVAAMLAVLALQAATGLFSDDEIATQGPLAVKVSEAVVNRMSTIHHYNQWVVLALVAVHLAAIAVYTFAWRVRLVPAMVHGRAEIGEAAAAAPRMRHGAIALALFAIACAAVYYLVVIFPRTPA